MKCSFIHQNLITYRENNLEPGIRKEIESHLLGCESCRNVFTGLEVIENAIDEAKTAEPNPFAATRIIRHIENNLEKRAGKRGMVFRPILLTLAVLGAIALGFTIGKNGFNRMGGTSSNNTRIETLKSDLYIHDFIEEDNTLLISE